MKKYNTRPIDFTGCHPVIAEALKRGEEIECRVWDNRGDVKTEAWIYRYKGGSDLPYRSGTDTPWKCAEPIARKVKRIMPPERAIPVLIENGYAFDELGALRGKPHSIVPRMFEKMGKPLDDNAWEWPPCIIEEVEDEWPPCIIEEVEDEW